MHHPHLILLGYTSIAIGLGWTCGVLISLVYYFLPSLF